MSTLMCASKCASKDKTTKYKTEHHGVGFITDLGPLCQNFVADCAPHSGRLIEFHVHNHGPDIYQVHSGQILGPSFYNFL